MSTTDYRIYRYVGNAYLGFLNGAFFSRLKQKVLLKKYCVNRLIQINVIHNTVVTSQLSNSRDRNWSVKRDGVSKERVGRSVSSFTDARHHIGVIYIHRLFCVCGKVT